MISRSLKVALLAAGAGVVASAAHASTPTVAAPAEDVATADIENVAVSATTAGAAGGLAAIAALLLAFFNRRRLGMAMRAAAPHVAAAGRWAVAAPAKAFRAVGSALGRPLRTALLLFAGAVFVLTGVDLLNVEWAAGLLVGTVTSALAFVSWRRVQSVARFMVNGN